MASEAAVRAAENTELQDELAEALEIISAMLPFIEWLEGLRELNDLVEATPSRESGPRARAFLKRQERQHGEL